MAGAQAERASPGQVGLRYLRSGPTVRKPGDPGVLRNSPCTCEPLSRLAPPLPAVNWAWSRLVGAGGGGL